MALLIMKLSVLIFNFLITFACAYIIGKEWRQTEGTHRGLLFWLGLLSLNALAYTVYFFMTI